MYTTSELDYEGWFHSSLTSGTPVRIKMVASNLELTSYQIGHVQYSVWIGTYDFGYVGYKNIQKI